MDDLAQTINDYRSYRQFFQQIGYRSQEGELSGYRSGRIYYWFKITNSVAIVSSAQLCVWSLRLLSERSFHVRPSNQIFAHRDAVVSYPSEELCN
mmetsp:Transcript_30397/g.73989  ORF Transcript_30397/g.73989 Transcript_30397/m.73989 type:complete len:95 (-) Transcript_30397:1896-2180(-)